jgi:osmoprotectant transport system permease protein
LHCLCRIGGLIGLALFAALPAGAAVTFGSKVFTESVILAEMGAQLVRSDGIQVEHRKELGGTRILWSALLRGDIHCYPEYTGTLRAEIFAGQALQEDAQLRQALSNLHVWASRPLGFNNTYVLGMTRARAQQLGIANLSGLRGHPELRFGFSSEFLERQDGWAGLRDHYALPQAQVRGLAHDLAYRGVVDNSLDVTDLYSTDAEIAHYDLVALTDDLRFFPTYDALFVCRDDVPPAVREGLNRLAGVIDATTMSRMNAAAKIDRRSENAVAGEFLRQRFSIKQQQQTEARWLRVLARTREHVAMVSVSLAAAIVLALPLGVLAFYRRSVKRIAFALAETLQTLPALALLVFLIPWLGIGYAPAIVALFLYSLLPILRGAYTGLAEIPRELRESARALGLPTKARLRLVELPLAARSIIAGIRTAAVINVGTATLGALVGAGGLGQPILTGIRLDDTALLLEGAAPAALLALAVQWLFVGIERRWVVAS